MTARANHSAPVAVFDLSDGSSVHLTVTLTGTPTEATRAFLTVLGRALARLGATLRHDQPPTARSRDQRRALGISRRDYARFACLAQTGETAPKGATP